VTEEPTNPVDEVEVLCRETEPTRRKQALDLPAGKIERSAEASRVATALLSPPECESAL
jgi:hypothetical protein